MQSRESSCIMTALRKCLCKSRGALHWKLTRKPLDYIMILKEEHCDKRLTSKAKSYLNRRPSLCRVAVVAFYSNCDGETKHMKCYRNRHTHHLLSEMMVNRLRCSSAPWNQS